MGWASVGHARYRSGTGLRRMIKVKLWVPLVITCALLLTGAEDAFAAKARLGISIEKSAQAKTGRPAIKTHKKSSELRYFPAPRGAPKGFTNLKWAKPKTPYQGGGGLRDRWKDDKGAIYEWDRRHGTIEKYDRSGRHLGEYDPNTGKQLKGAIASRKVEP